MSGFTGFDFSSAVVTSEKNVVTPAGISVPLVDHASMATWGNRTAVLEVTPVAQKLTLGRAVFPEGSDVPEQLNYAAYAVMNIKNDAPLDIIEKLGNLAELMVTGCMGVMFDCELVDAPVDEEMFRVYGTRKTADGVVMTDAAALRATVLALPEDDQWENFSLVPTTLKEATALFALCAYCVVKAPTQLNQTAFTMSRPLAAARGAGLTAYPRHLLPSIGDLALVNHALQGDRRARIPFAKCLVSWATTASVNAQQAGMASQASLWRDQAFGGLKMTRQLLMGHSAAVQRVARLRAQLPAFNEHWECYQACISPVRAYFGAIYGPVNPISARDDYSMLTLLARDIVQDTYEAGKGMRNFGVGRNVPPDVKKEFIAVCKELGLGLPELSR